ncbi:hypothetical protein ERJ75_001348600 [Trypanosoma vivax]|uniref:RIIa domain-containing protein n=1 Tax=Trypanosoma vivax (strain Y486) TaxID=1055687 RepID=G0U5R6_TRYVY|nr:hypothetical protein TRVL_02837 [Trypanosoma vivax]KAH8608314.1 hypothetical protein ERJ75_001348600 [Trypanosoma vivax]CCC51217.1 conserved hypothetical protein [Trypanosoma vivax Y486]
MSGGICNHASTSPDFPTLTEAATAILTPEELQNLRHNLATEKIAHAKYLRAHPEIDAIMRCAMRKLIMERPTDPVSALLDFFAHADLNAELMAKDEEAEKRAAALHEKRGLTQELPP